jgi:hypothetical protein
MPNVLSGKFANEQPSLRRAALIYLLLVLFVYGLPVVLGLSWLPTPMFYPGTPALPKFQSGYDTFSFMFTFLPYRSIVHQLLSSAQFPFWNPYNWFGIPIPAQYEFQVLSPLEWIDWLGGSLWWNLTILSKIWLAAIGGYLLVRRLTDSGWAGLAAGVLYTFSSYFIGFTSKPAYVDQVFILPWLFLVVTGSFEREKSALRVLGWGGLLFGLLFTNGQPQITAINLAGLAMFAAYCCVECGNFLTAVRGSGLLVVCAALGLLCASLQIAFFREGLEVGYTIHSPGTYSGGGTAPLNFILPLMPLILGQFLAPWLENMYPGNLNHEGFPLIICVAGFFLMVAGLAAGLARLQTKDHGRWTFLPFLAIAAVVLFIIIAGTTGLGHFWSFAVVNRINLPRYGTPLLTLCFSVIGGIGYRALVSGSRPLLVASFVLTLIALCAVHYVAFPYLRLPVAAGVDPAYRVDCIFIAEVSAWGSLFGLSSIFWFCKTPSARSAALLVAIAELSMTARYGFAIETELARVWIFFLLVLGAFAWAADRRMVASVLMGFAVLLDGALFHWAPHRLPPRIDYASQSHPSALFLKDNLGPWSYKGRVLSSQGLMVPSSLAPFAVAQVAGLNPLQIDSVAQMVRGSLTGHKVNYTIPVAWQGMVSDSGSDSLSWDDYLSSRAIYNELNVRFLVDRPMGWLSRVNWPAFRRVYSDSEYVIYEDLLAKPRAFFVPSHNVRSVDSLDAALTEIRRLHADFSNWIVVEHAPVFQPATQSTVIEKADLSMIAYTANHVVLNAIVPENGVIVLSDSYYPGWIATLDGKPTPILRAQASVRAIYVQRGGHHLEFHYDPIPMQRWGLLSALGWAVALVMIAASYLRRERILASRD